MRRPYRPIVMMQSDMVWRRRRNGIEMLGRGAQVLKHDQQLHGEVRCGVDRDVGLMKGGLPLSASVAYPYS